MGLTCVILRHLITLSGSPFSVFPDGRHRLRRSKPAQQAQASLSGQLGFPESMSEGLVGAPHALPTHPRVTLWD